MNLHTVRAAAAALSLVVVAAMSANVHAGRAPVAAPNASASTGGAPAQFDSEAQCVSSVPRAWGEFKGGSAQSGLAFQAPDGTLRFLTNLPCGAQAVVALKIMRTGNAASN